MHYSNTVLKIASLFLPHSSSHLTLSQTGGPWADVASPQRRLSIYTGNRVNGWSLYRLWKATVVYLSQELESDSQMSREATWAKKYGRDSEQSGGFFISLSVSFISITLPPPTFNLPPSLLHLAVRIDGVDVTWLQWNVTSGNLLPELIGLHCSGQGC